ncbi:TadE/TadG family type IV pilus assembly protein [Solirhodobacter olei]|uniref:TadE/TadG family type IV pilus assembly protein n=1 Tax=Solirhodobacter olei TaxID=2493082 RepID=UPI000FD8CBFB|nr:TadE family protein [Solirhodobacter olei]
MTPDRLRNFCRRTASHGAGEDGAVLVELALVLPLFLFILFGLIDFGRLAYALVMAESAVDMAARIAVVRAPACAGVPTANLRYTGSSAPVPAPPYGTSCSAGGNICAGTSAPPCTGVLSNTTASEIWSRVAPLMPSGTTVANLQFTYTYDPKLGFLGGPYVPMVTVALTGAQFQFVTPLAGLAQMLTGTGLGFNQIEDFPTISASLPGEDLAQGPGT